jgi:hypothetical protein
VLEGLASSCVVWPCHVFLSSQSVCVCCLLARKSHFTSSSTLFPSSRNNFNVSVAGGSEDSDRLDKSQWQNSLQPFLQLGFLFNLQLVLFFSRYINSECLTPEFHNIWFGHTQNCRKRTFLPRISFLFKLQYIHRSSLTTNSGSLIRLVRTQSTIRKVDWGQFLFPVPCSSSQIGPL